MKKIGIPGWVSQGVFGVGISYIEYFRNFGEVYILQPDQKIKLDLLVLPGGADLSPATYDSIVSMHIGQSNPMLDYFDTNSLPFYIQEGIPIFGICRGAQRLWTLNGGTLLPHYPNHKQSSHKEDLAHPLYYRGKKLNLDVTSRHHQVMLNEDIGFQILEDKDDDIVEGFFSDTVSGVQYHPEDNGDTDWFTPIIIQKMLNGEKISIEHIIKNNKISGYQYI